MQIRSSRFTRVMLALTIAAAALLVGLSPSPAEASHVRYGHINWHPAGINTIDFNIQNAFRRDAYECYSTVTLTVVPCTSVDGFPGPGDVIAEFVGFSQFDPGDGMLIGSPLGPLMYIVTAIDPANNWFFANALDPASLPLVDTNVTHTYAAPGNYTGFIDSCCRISATFSPNSHMNNPDGGYRFETLVNVGAVNSSPVSTMPPIVLCPINALCTFVVPGVDPDGDPIAFRLSTPAEASSFPPFPNEYGTQCLTTFCQPGPPFAPNAASISPTGVYTWDTTGAQLTAVAGNNTLYSTQVAIEDFNLTGGVQSRVVVDFLIQLVPGAQVGTPPHFDHPPTPVCGSTLTVNVGGTLVFTVQASDDDAGQTVILNAVGLPPGATTNPPLPTSGNPVSTTVTYTPGAPGTFVVTFTATDDTLQQDLCSLVIQVNQGPPPPPPNLAGRMTGGGGLDLADGTKVRHGFALQCDMLTNPHNLQVNWNNGGPASKFHLELITFSLCTDNPLISSGNPQSGFNTYEGEGIGRYNGQPNATAKWKFTDEGEPGKGKDYFEIQIFDSGGNLVLSAAGRLRMGNHQAH